MADPMEMLGRWDPLARGSGAARERGSRRYLVLDVFTDTPLQGNPLAVFLDGRGLEDALMQRLARELNLSESAFLLPARGSADLRVRIFTPAGELPFAGHPVLGCAIVAASALARESITLETLAADVPVLVRPGSGRSAFGRMRQPLPSWSAYGRAPELLAAVGVERSLLPVEVYDNGPRHVYVALGSEAEVATLAPDLRALAELGDLDFNCFAVAGAGCKTRMFAPAFGLSEDPATGSAAGPLAVHLARHGWASFGEEVEIRQGAEIGRPSLLYARVEGSPERIECVEVAGSAVILADAELLP